MKPPRILLVEDEFIVAGGLEARLLDLGYRVAGKADTATATELARATKPDLVLMDIRLKGATDGIKAAEQIRAQLKLPVVFLTAYAEDRALQQAKLAEPFGYVLKPFEDRELRTVIEMGLYKHQAERELRRLSQLYATLSQVNQTILRVRSREQLFAEVCRIGAEYAGFKMVWIGWLNFETREVVPVARAGESADFLDQMKFYADDRAGGCSLLGTALRQGAPCVINDYATEPPAGHCRELAATYELHAAAALPIRSNGQVRGALTVYAGECGVFRDQELALLKEAASDISFALDFLEHEEMLRKLARAVEQSPTTIMITDVAGNIEYVNPKFTQTTGYEPHEVLGQHPRMFKSGETPTDEYRRLWETILEGREWRGEFHNRRKDGTLYWETASISPVRDAGGKITHFVAIKEDVTEKKLLESKFLRAQRLESVGSLASGVAHDLNNILAPILMCSQMLELAEDPASRREFAELIESSAQRAGGIVHQLLSFARGQEGQKPPVQVRHLLREMAKIARETFPRNIQVEERCASDLWLVSADATQLHQVLLNLCINSRDALPEGGRLALRAENVVLDEHYLAAHPGARPGPYVRLQVEDSGTGMPEAVRQHVFESFFTTKSDGQGTGLGLTTVLGIVKNHGGFISFTSAEGKGTTFDIYLPAAPEGAPDAEATAPPTAIPRGRGELVLVVDDEPPILDTTRRSLERHGYTVLQASDGIQAVAQFLAHKDQVRAVVTDFMMPHMDGVTFCRTMRAVSPQTPLIVSSGGLFGKPGGEAEALRAFEVLGVRHILHKPHHAEVLLRALADALGSAAKPASEERHD